MAPLRSMLASLAGLSASSLVSGHCPGHYMGTPPAGHAPVPAMGHYREQLEGLDVAAVVTDINALLTDSQGCWPADFGHYGPFFIRLAWHCSGTYRETDGRGGCAGGRQRFEPEASWPDNANLDHARALLWPIKEKYGDALSWGDLFVTAGTAAIKHMGGPVSEFCVGRIDDPDGTSSLDLGPSPHQEKVAPCAVNGKCQKPLGTSTVGLIYVNPEGPVQKNWLTGEWKPRPNPRKSAVEIREVFSRMGMNDTETVALIGGGHAFGKAHGPCPDGPGRCGSGMGADTFTSGLDGPWTKTPTQWGNEFFRYLVERRWQKVKSPAGHWQFRIKNADASEAGLMRLVTDVALVADREYRQIVNQFATEQSALDSAFAAAWHKLTTSGGRWATNKRCVKSDIFV